MKMQGLGLKIRGLSGQLFAIRYGFKKAHRLHRFTLKTFNQ